MTPTTHACTSCTATAAADLLHWVRDARQRSLDLVLDLNDEQLVGPKLITINPLIWEIGHAAWFQEKWILRNASRRPPIFDRGDELWDSIGIAHERRWSLPLPSRQTTLDYVRRVADEVCALLEAEHAKGDLTPKLIYLVKFSVFHEDMHTEAFTYTRQTLGYPPPPFEALCAGGDDLTCCAAHLTSDVEQPPQLPDGDELARDVTIPGGRYELGASRDEPFVFDNEKWAHQIVVPGFRIARLATSDGEFATFVDDGGYRRKELWCEDGWAWRSAERAEHPLDWRPTSAGWQRRHFNRWLALDPSCAAININWYEAQAYCRWAGRRLPNEAEWEIASSWSDQQAYKRRYPWGDESRAGCANLDWRGRGAVDTAAMPGGDTASGCRQMLGNVWEWTSTTFAPFPAFVPDMYQEYSTTSFYDHKVLRGGCWTTRSRLIRNTWRNYYTPDRRDTWCGFRTCAIETS